MTKTKWQNVERSATAAAHAQEVKDLKDQLQQFEERTSSLQKQLDVALTVGGTKLKTVKIPSPSKEEGSKAAAFAIASDWHAEETVDGRTVNGLNDFNLEIAEQRIVKFFDTVIRLTEIERAGTTIDTLVLAFLGDLMTGYIHEELQESNGLSPTETVLWLRTRIVCGLRKILTEGNFSRIIVPCCIGNHGRTTKKPRHGTAAANSYEWMLYNILSSDVPEVEWVIADGYHNYIEVFGKTIRLHHGDNIAYQGGVGGITISVEKAIASWNKARVADLDIFGHHHTQQQNPRWISNGSLIGYGAYSLAIKAGFESPQQTFFLFDSKRGRTVTTPIHLA